MFPVRLCAETRGIFYESSCYLPPNSDHQGALTRSSFPFHQSLFSRCSGNSPQDSSQKSHANGFAPQQNSRSSDIKYSPRLSFCGFFPLHIRIICETA
jgi:hypothetical protein